MSATKKSVSLFASAAVFCVMFSLAIGSLQGVPAAHAAGAQQWESGGMTAPSIVYTVTYVIGGPTGGVGVHNNAK